MRTFQDKKITKLQLSITLILVLFLSITGTTFAYFTTSENKNNSLTGDMATVNLSLDVTKIFPTESSNNTGAMVPQLSTNTALESALKGACVDANKNIACQVYKINVSNNGGTATEVVNGFVYFYSDSALTQDASIAIPNLRWRLVESVNNTTPASSVLGNNTNHTAGANGDNKFVSNLTMVTNSSIDYYMIVWVNEINENQPQDTDKTFYGKVEFEASNGSGVTGVFGDIKPAIDDT